MFKLLKHAVCAAVSILICNDRVTFHKHVNRHIYRTRLTLCLFILEGHILIDIVINSKKDRFLE